MIDSTQTITIEDNEIRLAFWSASIVSLIIASGKMPRILDMFESDGERLYTYMLAGAVQRLVGFDENDSIDQQGNNAQEALRILSQFAIKLEAVGGMSPVVIDSK